MYVVVINRWRKPRRAAYAEILLKESFQLVNDALLLLFPVSAAKAADRGHELINIRADSLHLAIPEGIFQKLPGLLRLQLFICNDGRQIRFTLPGYKAVPF